MRIKIINRLLGWMRITKYLNRFYFIFFRNIKFIDDNKDVWNFCDVVVTDLPEILDSKPEGKISIKINKLYNKSQNVTHTIDK